MIQLPLHFKESGLYGSIDNALSNQIIASSYLFNNLKHSPINFNYESIYLFKSRNNLLRINR